MSKLSDKLDLKKDFPYTSFDEWKKVAEKDLKGLPFDKKLITKTYEGIDLQPIYTNEDLSNNPLVDSFPGFHNHVRGNKSKGNVENSWLVSQELPYYSPADYNAALKFDLPRGLSIINFKLDKATLLSKDPDTASENEIGFGGTSVSTYEDIEACFRNVDITKYPILVNGGYSALPVFSLFISYFKKTGINLKKINATFLSDPFVYSLASGTTPFDVDAAFDEIYKMTKWSIDNKANIKTIGICGYEYVNAGASAVQELAYVMSSAIEYINQMIKRGLTIDEIAPRIHFTFGITTFYFMEVAKLRAARILWSNIIDAFKGKEESKDIFIHSKTSVYNQTQNDIYVNMLRTTTEAFSAVVGGADSIYTSPFDETIGLPDEFSRRLARNTQIVLREESHVNNVIDPAGGSYYVETLTSDVAIKSWELLKSIETNGGMFEALKTSVPQDEIEKLFASKHKDYAKRKNVLVGNNMYANIKEDKVTPKENDLKEFELSRKEYIKNFRVMGEDKVHNKVMGLLQEISSNPDNLIDLTIDAFTNGATIGEVGKSLQRKASDFQFKPLNLKRASEIFEELRDISFSYKDKNGYLPKIFLASFGPLKQHKPRADFARGFFEVGGFDVIYRKGFDTIEEAVKESVKSEAKIFVICSTDDTYPELVPAYIKDLKSKLKDVKIILAGYPKEQIDEHKKSGVDDFIFLGADVYEINKMLLNEGI
jgi:methylmalonyl-CoA mutase